MNEITGSGWRYQCWHCGFQVTLDAAFPEKCPGCGVGGWWGHLTPQDGTRAENSRDKLPNPIKTRNDNLSQVIFENNNDILENNRPGPRPLPLDNMIKELASRGLSSRGIAAALTEQGISISYKTVQRRLQGSLL